MSSARLKRIVQAVALGLGIGLALSAIHTGLVWTDGHAYWAAAERLRIGEELYPSTTDPESADAYRYAPWFAWLWVPLTFFPEPMVAVGWTAGMVAAWAVPVSAYVGSGWIGRAVVLLAGPPLLVAALGGNVQPAVIALLHSGIQGRWGPIAIGVAASLKIFPVLFALVYAARRQWVRAGLAGAIGALLWLPVLAYGIDAYPAVIGGALSLWTISPIVYLVVVGLFATLTVRRPSWSMAGLLLLLASVRFIPYHLSYLLVAPPTEHERPD